MFDQKEVKPRELIPEGKYNARLYEIVDMGTHEDIWDGIKTLKHQIHIGWELVDTKMEDGRPFVIGKRFNLTNGRYGVYIAKSANLNKLLRNWMGWDEKMAGNVRNLMGLMGKEAIIQIGQERGKKDPSRIYNVIESIKPYRGKEMAALQNPTVIYGLGANQENPGENFEALYPWQKEHIAKCIEWNGGLTPPTPKEEEKSVDDIPF